MEMAASPRTVEEIFKDYSGRRAGVVRALTYGTLLSLSTITLSLSLSLSLKILIWPLLFLIQMLMNFMDSVIQVLCN